MNKIVRNTFWLFIGDVLSKVIVFLFTLLIARRLGVAGFGVYSFVVAFVMMFSQFINLGLPTFLTREISRNREHTAEYTGGAILICIPPALLFPAIMLAIIYALNYTSETQLLVLFLGMWIVADGFSFVFKSSFYAYEKMQYVTLINISFQIVRIAIVFLVLKLGLGVIGVGKATLLASLVTLAFSVYLFLRYFPRPKFNLDIRFWVSNLKQCLPLALLAMLLGYFGKVDNIMLSLMKGNEAVGFYSASFKLVATFIFIPAVIVHASFPRMSQQAFRNPEEFGNLIAILLKVISVLVIPVTLGLFLFARPIIQVIYGEAYLSSYHVLQVLAWMVLVNAISYVFIYGLNAKNKQTVTALFAGGALLTNIGINMMVIPRFGYVGAAYSSLFSETLLLGGLIIYALRQNYIRLRMLVPSLADYKIIYNAIERSSGS